jgi:3',5'-cyclic-AMP phosphodiesterase
MKSDQYVALHSTDFIEHDRSDDGIDRRGFLKCMAWAGTGLLWSASAGLLSSGTFADAKRVAASDLSFVQISDSHIGFKKAANADVTGTLQAAVDKINELPTPPAFILHTGDLSQIAQADQFDTVDQILKGAKTQSGQVFYVPGEHDVIGDGGALYMQRYGKGTKGAGYYSFDISGTHFVGLVNVVGLDSGALGELGPDQLAWLKEDVRHLSSSTPIVVFAHVPLWEVYPQWGWGTSDGAAALSLLKRFGSVTVLNGHIHQVQQKVEGTVAFHTAMSTAFPQPAPGTAAGPGPMVVPAGQLGHVLGITQVTYVEGAHQLALVDSPLIDIGGPQQ